MPKFIEEVWALLVLHAFPAMTLIIPIFPMLHWTGMLDTRSGIVLVLTTLELPFAIFIMKGLFDAVPWDIEMSAMTDGASRLVHVEDLLERLPSEMSGGQQQRMALARAVVKQPQLLLLDEPLSNRDATLRLTLRSEIRSLHRRLGVTLILVTHDELEATTLTDRVTCMRAGKIEQIGTPDDLHQRLASLSVAGFVGAPPMTTSSIPVTAPAVPVGMGSRS